MALKIKYASQQTAVASYSYEDIAEGTGITKFYFIIGTGPTYFLSTQELHSASIEQSETTTSPTVVLITTTNYDLQPFNLPKIVGGTALYEIGTNTDGGSGDSTGRIVIKIQHYDGINPATTIGTATLFDTTSNDLLDFVRTGTFTVTKKAFKKGDVLRLAVEFWGRQETGTRRITMGTDPQNRDGTQILPASTDNITKSAIYIPFNLDL